MVDARGMVGARLGHGVSIVGYYTLDKWLEHGGAQLW